MEPQTNNRLSTGSEAIAALLAVGAGTGVGYALWLATGNVVLGIITASAIAHLANNLVRGMLRKGRP